MKLYPGQEMIRETVKFRGHDIDVEATYTPPQRAIITADPFYSEPSEGGEVDDFIFLIGGENFTDLLEEQQDEILDSAILQHEKSEGRVA